MGLGAGAKAAGFRHLHIPGVGSTNVEALDRDQDRLWVTADEQTAGRGRRGRDWSSPPGNLYASLLLKSPAEPRRAADLCFVAALALSDAIGAVAPRAAAGLALKWPNDVLVFGSKVAGILVEGVHRAEGFTTVIGCGVNIASHPHATPIPATHLRKSDASATIALLFRSLSDAVAARLALWNRGTGFAVIRQDWLAQAAGVGQRIVVRLPGGEVDGVFEALDPEGALVLRENDGGLRSVSAGEVFFSGHSLGSAR
jgi:BirA family biotin operon repressor/biotin-[acetyl-CoA-carboxylase] ligase